MQARRRDGLYDSMGVNILIRPQQRDSRRHADHRAFYFSLRISHFRGFGLAAALGLPY